MIFVYMRSWTTITSTYVLNESQPSIIFKNNTFTQRLIELIKLLVRMLHISRYLSDVSFIHSLCFYKYVQPTLKIYLLLSEPSLTVISCASFFNRHECKFFVLLYFFVLKFHIFTNKQNFTSFWMFHKFSVQTMVYIQTLKRFHQNKVTNNN